MTYVLFFAFDIGRYAGTLSITIVFVLCAIAFFFSIIVYRLAAKAALSRNENEGIASSASLLASLSASVIDIVAIVALDKVSVHYNACAVFLSIHVLVLF